MTDIDANYIARTQGIDALRRTIDSTSTEPMSDGEQYPGITHESSACVLTELAPVEHEAIGIHPAAEEKKSFLDGNAPTRAESGLVMAPSSQSAEMKADKTNSGQQQGHHQKNQQDQRQKN
jgi:hypothetical protein